MDQCSNQFLQLIDLNAFAEVVKPQASLLAGVSGGADSVAMLRSLVCLCKSGDYSVSVVHVNHGLRPEAAAEEDFVRTLCQQFELPFTARKTAISEKTAASSPEEFWRKLRYDEFEDVFSEGKYDYLALGHTLDDLAETFLFHLARGTGIDGLRFSFYKQTGTLPIIRPLWKTKRTEIEAALTLSGQQWVNDPSNLDTRYSRNLIRKVVVPALQQINPAVTEAIFNVSGDIGSSVSSTTKPAAIMPHNSTGMGSDSVARILDLQEFTLSDTEQVATAVWDYVKLNTRTPMTRRQTEQSVRMLQNHQTGIVSLTGSNTLVITQDIAWVYPGHQPSNVDLAKYHVRHQNVFAAMINPANLNEATSPVMVTSIDGRAWRFSWDGSMPMILRNRNHGDRIGSKRLAKLLIEHRIPWYLRDFVIVAEQVDGPIAAVAVMDQNFCASLNRRIQPGFKLEWTRADSQDTISEK